MQNQEVQSQSKKAFEKWNEDWVENAKANKKRIYTSHRDYMNCYKDKIAFLFSYGPSFTQNVLEFKMSEFFGREDVVIGCVDKAFRPLSEIGIQPDFCLIADGQVKHHWLEGADDGAIQNCILISNIYGQPEWSEHWARVSGVHNILWYLNKDNLEVTPNNKCGTADIFCNHADYYEVIPAASNVGNSLVVFPFQIFGVRTFYLNGYDYCWKSSNYYGSVDSEKRNYLGQSRPVDADGNIVWANVNMEFSSKWLDRYMLQCQALHGAEFLNCTKGGLLKNAKRRTLYEAEVYWKG